MPHILTVPRAQAPTLPETGCWPVQNLDFCGKPSGKPAPTPSTTRPLQPIPYLLLMNASGQLWCYQRSGGDTRLDGRCSCGVGGHGDWQDARPALEQSIDSCQRIPDKGYKPISSINPQATLQHALLREVAEDLGATAADLAQSPFMA
ncbi:MAG: hypothetical protein IPN53_25720 [Comamonadaceae bacterium]|nr:hypothetical protein [Comamonadaceae bacterium]